MINMIEKVREEIRNTVHNAILEAFKRGRIHAAEVCDIIVETPREKEYGDFSTNVAMQISGKVAMPPRQTAEIIVECMKLDGTYIKEVKCAGPGFINFYLKDEWLYDTLSVIREEKDDYGRLNISNGEKVMVEFVSANPTGPLHMGNARGGALGDCIANVLEAVGYDVTREFYVNDTGNQMEKFGLSLEARYIQLLKGEDEAKLPEGGYHGEDIIDLMRDFIAENGDKLLYEDSAKRREVLVRYALAKNLESIKRDLESYGVRFDVWFSEQSLYDSGEFKETMDYLKNNGFTVEKEGALWFKATQFGAEKDEVIIRSNGMPTYFASDIAYHRNKFLKRNFDRVINLLGADHHGHAARMKSAVSALGVDPSRLDIIIFQLVRLYRNGEVARMSKRTGKAISLADLIEEVGKDAARFFFNTKAAGNHLDFDLDLAVKQSNENPVYYVQYAHARICSMLTLLEADGVKASELTGANLGLLKTAEEIELMKKLAGFPEEVRLAAQTLEPSRLTRYVTEVASLFHSFYNACRVKGEERRLMEARTVLVDCTRIVIKNVLDLLSISAPTRM